MGILRQGLKNVSTHSRLKAAGISLERRDAILAMVSTHSRLKAAGFLRGILLDAEGVSTHSRLKAAGYAHPRHQRPHECFNTQPPKGGWEALHLSSVFFERFQHTAA